jgi:hypothetical protein
MQSRTRESEETSFESTSSTQECTLAVQTDPHVESLMRAFIERTAAERRRSIAGTYGDDDSDGCESDDDSWMDD